MANILLALCAGIASGSEPSFDKQPTDAGTHLRWTFRSALGFPSGGFQLWRRIAQNDLRLPQPPLLRGPGLTALGPVIPPPNAAPGWGAVDTKTGWQAWGSLFVLPVTQANWPARYFGAPNPADPAVSDADVKEGLKRLGSLKLLPDGNTSASLTDLRKELLRLVQGFPGTLLDKVPLNATGAGANAPQLNLSLMDQLLLLALNPYFARVLGLYFVDKQADPKVSYNYAVVGYWGNVAAASDVVYPGLAPAAQLAKGSASIHGLRVVSSVSNPKTATGMWRWLRTASGGTLDPTCPAAVQQYLPAALAGLVPAPTAVLIAGSTAPAVPAVTLVLPYGGMPQVNLQVSGSGPGTLTVTTFDGNNQVNQNPVPFNAGQLQTIALSSTDPNQPIRSITIQGGPNCRFVFVGAVELRPVAQGAIGARIAIAPPAQAIKQLAAPAKVFGTFRRRSAQVEAGSAALVPRSLYDVEWPAPPVSAADKTGDPVDAPNALPQPGRPVGYIVRRRDAGKPLDEAQLPDWVTTRVVPAAKDSAFAGTRILRTTDSNLPDPVSGWSYTAAAFDIFGVLGKIAPWSPPVGIERVAAPPTTLKIVQFDNTAEAGGKPAPDGSAWTGGTLRLQAAWAASAFLMNPDVHSARAEVVAIDDAGNVTGPLTNFDFAVPAPKVQQLTLTSLTATPSPDGQSYNVEIRTTPPMTALPDSEPAQTLVLVPADPDVAQERLSVRPVAAAGGAVVRLSSSKASRLVSEPGIFISRPAYLISGWGTTLNIGVPLNIPANRKNGRGQVSILISTSQPFAPGEQITDPNGKQPPRLQPRSAALAFSGPQRLQPAVPALPPIEVNHVYYDPADLTGTASKVLPFSTSAGLGVTGFVLRRASVQALINADMRRRAAANNIADAQPVVLENGAQRPNLAAWLSSLSTWLVAYNKQHGTGETAATLLTKGAGQRAFAEHFYGGLLDDELRALANLEANSAAFTRLNPQPLPPNSAIRDSVDGTGYTRNLYQLAALNVAGSASAFTASIGPYYTRPVTPPRAPVLYKVQSAPQAVVIAWSLDSNPDVAAYLVYRAASEAELADLRFFGSDPKHPAPLSALPTLKQNAKVWPPIEFVPGTGGNVDPRLIGVVLDPRLCARDYAFSTMGEVVLPSGPAPDSITGVYRLSEYDASKGSNQIAFNYWVPSAANDGPKIVADSPTQARLTGLRIGLGRGVPVVVVGKWNGTERVLGAVPVRRAGFVDGLTPTSMAADANALPGSPLPTAAPAFYSVVAVDIAGNRSVPSRIFLGQMLPA